MQAAILESIAGERLGGVGLLALAVLAVALACSRASPGGAEGPPTPGANTVANIVQEAPGASEAAPDEPRGRPSTSPPADASVAPPAIDPAVDEPAATPPTDPADAADAAPGKRPCRNNERLDSGCECRSGGACFDVCCGPNAGCAHPRTPGGRSACILQARSTTKPPPAPPAPACSDGELLASGCTCEGTRCMDLCCVGSACSHHAGPGGGAAKCVTPRRIR